MAIGKASDFTIYQEEFHTGVSEQLARNVAAFNEASGGTIVLRDVLRSGDYSKSTFFDTLHGNVIRRDTTDVSTSATDIAITQSEKVSVKLARTWGPFAQTRDAWRKIDEDPAIMSFILGEQMADAILQDFLDSALRGGVSAMLGNAGVLNDDSGAGSNTATIGRLIDTFALFGDKASAITTLVMHSVSWNHLLQEQATGSGFSALDTVAGSSINTGEIAALGKRVIVTDSAALHVTATGEDYFIMGLTPNALVVEESEQRDIVTQPITDKLNISDRITGEFAYNVGVKGYAWDITNGGANPADATVATSTNWDQVATDDKSTAGVLLRTDS